MREQKKHQVNQVSNQSINQSINESINQSINQSINPSVIKFAVQSDDNHILACIRCIPFQSSIGF